MKILDFGAGTGLVAEELIKLGFRNIYGVDINKDLLQKSQNKNCYQGLYLSNPNDDDSLDFIFDNTFDAIVSAGTFFIAKSYAGML